MFCLEQTGAVHSANIYRQSVRAGALTATRVWEGSMTGCILHHRGIRSDPFPEVTDGKTTEGTIPKRDWPDCGMWGNLAGDPQAPARRVSMHGSTAH